MNSKSYIFAIILAISFGLACSGDDPKEITAREAAFEKLEGSWTFGNSGSIVLDGQDVSLNYPGFALSFADGIYQTQNAGDLFRATGTWEWTDESAASLLLDTGEEVTIIELTETNFRFSFTLRGGGGEAAGIDGAYVVSLVK